jgi:hypothetical protein
MTTINAVGNGLSGAIGSGNFVGANTPTLITPVLGAATATSVNFGGSSLSTYTTLTPWTPTLTFATPGNLSVSYATQTGYYMQIGSLTLITFQISCTPTYTTASGNMQISGSGLTAATFQYIGSAFMFSSGTTWPAGRTSINLLMSAATNFIQLFGSGTGVADSVFTTTQVVTATNINFGGTILITV